MDEQFRESISFEHQNFVTMPDRSSTQTAVMALVKLVEGKPHPLGTCFSISNDGLCLTARYVIEEAFHEALSLGRDVSERDGWIYALYASPTQEGSGHPNHDLGGLLAATRVHIVNGFDIAALHLNLPVHSVTGERLPMPAHRLGLAPPRVGERCLAIGYHAMEWDAAEAGYNVQHEYSATMGTIEEIHIPRRDSSSLNFPCFRTSARFDGGMSGAPVHQ